MLAHTAGGGAAGAPTWLLAYLGVAIVFGTALALRIGWPRPRLSRQDDGPPPPAFGPHVGHLVGALIFGGTLYAAFAGPNFAAANIAPVAVFVGWIAIPVLCLVLGDVVRWLNPFVGLIRLVERATGRPSRVEGPTWVPAAFLLAFSWYMLAYYRPGSPRALGTFLAVYALAALGAGWRWGSGWLAVGEGFGALSAAIARIAIPRPRVPLPPGTTLLMTVWLGSTVFDGLAGTDFWADVLASSRGWGRTFLNTVGLVWVVGIVGACVMTVLRVAEHPPVGEDEPHESTSMVRVLGLALVPLAAGWFLAHDLPLLLQEGQNLYALISDPLGRGWDLFGTINHTVDFSFLDAGWLEAIRVIGFLAGNVAAVVLAHDGALRLVRRRAALRTTWSTATAAAVSVITGTLLALT